MAALEAGLANVQASPATTGTLELIVRRPEIATREVVETCELDRRVGLVGDSWHTRGNKQRPDGSADPAKQVTVMNARAIALIAGPRECWALAGDQLYVDLDLSVANLPPGARLRIGEVILEVTAAPHTGCKKFCERFGLAALEWVNSPAGRAMNLRGINVGVVSPGRVHRGDLVRIDREPHTD